jgi:pSer/pThr/pTyr-binding forkhead associated (FHA) protein
MRSVVQPIKASPRPTLSKTEERDVSVEKHYSVAELAKIWNLSENTIRRIFENEPNVLKWGITEGRFKRRYTTLRIPETVVSRVHRELRRTS